MSAPGAARGPAPLAATRGGRAFDLPPRWDGVPVTWGAWSEGVTTLIHHAPAEALACHKCGAVDERAIAWGSRPPATETILSPVEKRTRSGRGYVNYEHVPAWPVRDLFAARCRHCGHDTVTDERTGDVWELDAEDYTTEGSTSPDTLF